MQNGNKRILFLGLITIVVFPIIGFSIHYFVADQPFLNIFQTKIGVLLELFYGAVAGTIGGALGWKIITRKFMLPVRQKYQGVIASLQLNVLTIVLVSICAGVGEEILFRGVIQPHLGIWLTAVLFVAIHGYLSPKDRKISLYGSFMVLLIALLGYMKQIFGLSSAMTAHAFIDIVLFYQLTNQQLKQHIASPIEPID